MIEYVAKRDLVDFRWIEWVRMRNMPLAEVVNPLTRELAGISSSDHVSSRSLPLYIKYLVLLVEAEIASVFSPSCSTGWADKPTHYVAVFAMFVDDNKVREMLLGSSPPLDEK